ncbi:hypothetical protein M2454_001814 [Aequitasia blattaphilus]|uniref:ACT domain-containing protein n=1 Tax=Aequitasia blattaphilus TaxID=2949332 RepID=A0ABT1E905_9FIRM|nr:ACT domain-containing protein [Aequitasia blattaphilus]MCP1102312.1 ACT domain-containing protein [Aequitasia blattaphilus]MCR8614952.1 ACT domain-containing protein [Aequitasia blattaphilus]
MIRQVSIFVENRPGSLREITQVLADAKINIRAFAAVDTPEFGILRTIVDEPQAAKECLTSKGFVVRVQEVIGVELVDEEGNLDTMLRILSEENVNINYIYSFVIRQGRAPIMVFQPDNGEKAEAILRANNITMIEEKDL